MPPQQEPDFDVLKNTGMTFFGKRPVNLEKTPRTVVVIGSTRGGTSLASGVMHHLGIYMGERAWAPVYENTVFDEAFKSGGALRKLVDAYNSEHDVWGLKRPDVTLNNIRTVHKVFRNPIYIVIFRDIFAIANRNVISMHADVLDNMYRAVKVYERILNFLRDLNPYAFLCSYDKSVQEPDLFVQNMIEFCGLEQQVTPEQIQAAREFISPAPLDYLDGSRITRSKGKLERVNKRFIRGWARYNRSKQSAEVILFIDGKEIARTTADLYREDLKDDDAKNSDCGFEFTGYDPDLLRFGSEVRVRVSDDARDIKNSPYLFKPPKMAKRAKQSSKE